MDISFKTNELSEIRNGFEYGDFLTLLTAIGIASKDFMRKDIDEIFNKNKVTYINRFKNSKFYNSKLLKSLPYSHGVYAERVIGIIEECLSANNSDILLSLYKLRFKKIYNRLKNKEKVSIEDILKTVSNFNEGEFPYEVISTIYIFIAMNKLKEDKDALGMALRISTNQLLAFEFIEDVAINEKELNKYKEEMNSLKSQLGIKKNSYTLEEFINDMVSKDEKENPNKDANIKTKADILKNMGARAKNICIIDGFLKIINIYSYEFSRNYVLTKEDIDKLLFNCIICCETGLIENKEDDLFKIFIPQVYTYILSKEYHS